MFCLRSFCVSQGVHAVLRLHEVLVLKCSRPNLMFSGCCRQFKQALGKDRFEKVKHKGVFNAITEEDFR